MEGNDGRSATKDRYPALLLGRLTPAYDLFVRLLLREGRFKRQLVTAVTFAPGQRVLDLGAGTGTLAIMVKQAYPGARVTGVDGDPDVLAIARENASRAGIDVTFDEGDATALPYPEESFDRVLSSLVFSLLSSEVKVQAAREAYRVLRSEGELHLADFGPPHTPWGRLLARRMRRFEPIADNLAGRLPGILQEAGFREVEEASRLATALGTLSILRGRKPAG